MPLKSKYFHGNVQLESASREDRCHVTLGARGGHVEKIQLALQLCDKAIIEVGELASKTYGHSTATAVLNFKKKRNIVNRSYQTQADNIVGIRTMDYLDCEMLALEGTVKSQGFCCRFCASRF
jgi:hypothetical protein